MEHGREHLNPHHQPRAGTREVAAARGNIHDRVSEGALPWRTRRHALDVPNRLLEIVATGHGDHEWWPDLLDVGPRNRHGWNARAPKAIRSACALDHLR